MLQHQKLFMLNQKNNLKQRQSLIDLH